MRTLASFATSMLLITSIILSGAVITIPVTLTDKMAFSEKIDQKQIQQKDDDNSQNYQQMYKQYDFVKYLNYHYTYNKEYMENLDSNSDADISEKKPSAASTAIYNNFIDKDNNKKQQEQQQQPHSEREKDEDKAKYILELDDKKKKHLADDTKYSSDKNDKKTYKNIKIIECRNFNINAYEIQDLKGIENLLNKPTTFENNDVNSNQKGKSHIENNSREVNEYEINSNTKVIFICNNTNHDLLPINSTTLIQPIPSDGIILPTHSETKNNNGEDKTAATTTISYAQYKKSIANDQN